MKAFVMSIYYRRGKNYFQLELVNCRFGQKFGKDPYIRKVNKYIKNKYIFISGSYIFIKTQYYARLKILGTL